MANFKAGDKVRIKDEHLPECSKYADMVLTVTVVDIDDLTHFITEGGEHSAFFGYRFELVPNGRTEGRTIKAKDIRVGDEILNAFQSEDLTLHRQGVVAEISERAYGVALSTASNRRIDSDPRTDTYTLVKAVPEVDLVREKLKETPEGTVVEFYTSPRKPILARKKQAAPMEGGSRWVVYFPSGQHTMSEKAFAEHIREEFDKLRWLS